MSLQKGWAAEEVAKQYLITQGLRWVHSHFRSRYGEIDLIMRDDPHIVFVEVKCRQYPSFSQAMESITRSKQRKLRVTAAHYLSARGGHLSEQARFDVVILSGSAGAIEWIQDAFQ